MSFGVTDSMAADSLEQLMQIADAGLYESKQAGRDRVTVGERDPAAPAPVLIQGADDLPAPTHSRRWRARPPLHEAADEEEPRPTGIEIR